MYNTGFDSTYKQGKIIKINKPVASRVKYNKQTKNLSK